MSSHLFAKMQNELQSAWTNFVMQKYVIVLE